MIVTVKNEFNDMFTKICETKFFCICHINFMKDILINGIISFNISNSADY